MTMLKLGNIKFSISTAAYNSIAKTYNYNWQAVNRFGNTPALQYTGESERATSFNGTIYPGQYGSAATIKNIISKASEGKPLLLVSGLGDVLGYLAIKNINQTDQVLTNNGQPRKITYSVKLIYYGDKYAVQN